MADTARTDRKFYQQYPFLVEGVQEQIDQRAESILVTLYTDGIRAVHLTDGVYESDHYLDQQLHQQLDYRCIERCRYYCYDSDHSVLHAEGRRKLPPRSLSVLPRRYRRDGQEVLGEIDTALSNFIIGKVILNLILSIMIYIGFLIIGAYSLLLTVISFLNFIPYIERWRPFLPSLSDLSNLLPLRYGPLSLLSSHSRSKIIF